MPSRAKIPAPRMANETGMIFSAVVERVFLNSALIRMLRFRVSSVKSSNDDLEISLSLSPSRAESFDMLGRLHSQSRSWTNFLTPIQMMDGQIPFQPSLLSRQMHCRRVLVPSLTPHGATLNLMISPLIGCPVRFGFESTTSSVTVFSGFYLDSPGISPFYRSCTDRHRNCSSWAARRGKLQS